MLTLQDEDIGTIPAKQRALEATVSDAQSKLELIKQLQPHWLRYDNNHDSLHLLAQMSGMRGLCVATVCKETIAHERRLWRLDANLLCRTLAQVLYCHDFLLDILYMHWQICRQICTRLCALTLPGQACYAVSKNHVASHLRSLTCHTSK